MPALDAGVPLRDVQEAASHADPRTTCAVTALASRSTGTPSTSSPPTSQAPPAERRPAGRTISRRPAGGSGKPNGGLNIEHSPGPTKGRR